MAGLVGVVTQGALSLLYRCVDHLHRIKSFMALSALFSRIVNRLERVPACRNMAGEAFTAGDGSVNVFVFGHAGVAFLGYA